MNDSPDIKLRISSELRGKLDRARGENARTLNAEIVARLEQSFRDEETKKPAWLKKMTLADYVHEGFSDVHEKLEALEKRIIALEPKRPKAK